MIQIEKASAGSGKTFSLSKHYRELLKERFDYRHILAVTFTNKATAEMKERILRDLKRSGDSGDTNAANMLSDILHDYSAFSVSTIDKFFQRTLKAFAREIGQMSDYQIELDKDSLIQEAMDRLLSDLTPEDSQLLQWLEGNLRARLSQGKSPNIEDELYTMGKRLKSDEFRGIDTSSGLDRDRLGRIRDNCDTIISSFHKEVNKAAALLTVKGANAVKQLEAYKRPLTNADKVGPMKVSLAKEVGGSALEALLTGDGYKWYTTAQAIRKSWFALGLADEFFKTYDQIAKERGILCLDDSNALLHNIIDGSDAPFIYEKMGTRYSNFLLDEFQDTSGIQWQNFLPLLRESVAGDNFNLIVGDVKQSIYRWRDSDWSLLHSKVKESFGEGQINEEPKQFNWRSNRQIISFNNDFFSWMKGILGSNSSLYDDVKQSISEKKKQDPQDGYVRVTFCPKDREADMVVESVRKALEAGAELGDITVLVRNNDEGSTIANTLIDNGISVISDDSLSISGSVVVRRLISLLSSSVNESDSINQYMVQKCGGSIPDEYHSIPDLCERLIRGIAKNEPELFNRESLYINAFMDALRDWVDSKGEDIRHFIEFWKSKDRFIGTPENKGSVRILTVHKAKGLEAPYIIFPYIEKVTRYKADWRWCSLSPDDLKDSPFIPETAGFYPVELIESTASSLFSRYYCNEAANQLIDNMNIMYVALTRATKCMHLIASEPPQDFKGKDFNNFSQLLFTYCCGGNYSKRDLDVEYGTMYDFRHFPAEERKKESRGEDLFAGYNSWDFSDRLQESGSAAEFFRDIIAGEDSARKTGIVLHGILSEVQRPEDLPRAVEDAVQDGLLEACEGDSTLKLLEKRITSHPEFFNPEALARNEVELINASGEALRPDRVIIQDGHVTIVDYKFGKPNDEYTDQVAGYMDLYRQLGYKDVRGFLWYVYTDKVVEVEG